MITCQQRATWVIYEQNFRLEVAGTSQSWARVDPSIYTQCFMGNAINGENWCAQCQELDQSSARCPYRPQKRPWSVAFSQTPSKLAQGPNSSMVCRKFNQYNGDCRHRKQCFFQHCCSECVKAMLFRFSGEPVNEAELRD